ncbi:hypothetical protein ACIP5Y_24970 [Nocardia sp. NPDC088792]|uniref:hypothetical protein n=1 Tax=Nocardia sp. NPDC088792 TaxID=3364332 RepID=UPI0038083D48
MRSHTRYSSIVAGMLGLCGVLVPQASAAGQTGTYLRNNFYSDWCVTDRGGDSSVALEACNFGADGHIAANQEWDRIIIDDHGPMLELRSGLGDCLAYDRTHLDQPMSAVQCTTDAVNLTAVWVRYGAELTGGYCVPTNVSPDDGCGYPPRPPTCSYSGPSSSGVPWA